MMEKVCGNCRMFKNEDADGWGTCDCTKLSMHCSEVMTCFKAKEDEPLEGEKLNTATEYEEYVKPPIGLAPAFTVYEPRLQAIEEAIERYVEAGKDIPFEWLKEKSNLIKYFIEEELRC